MPCPTFTSIKYSFDVATTSTFDIFKPFPGLISVQKKKAALASLAMINKSYSRVDIDQLSLAALAVAMLKP